MRTKIMGALACWIAIQAGGASAQIIIGQTAGFTGAVAAGVKETTDGARLYIDAVNARGGVNGQKIELLSLDDKFDPKLAFENARILTEEKGAVALFLSRGTPHTQAILPVLEKNGIAMVAPSTGAMALHQPVLKYVFNVRATYQREVEKAIAHLHTLGMTRIGVLHTDDTFGTDGLTGAQKGFAATGLKPVFVEKFDRAKPDFSKTGAQTVQSDAQAVIFIGSGSAVVDGINVIRAAGSSAQIVTLSNNASAGFIKSLGDSARGVLVTQVFPNERSIAFPIVKEAMELGKQAGGVGLSPAMLEGFAGAKVLVEALRRAGKAPSRAKIVAALESMNKLDLGGLEIGFSPGDHTGLDFVDLSIIGTDGKFRR